MTDRVAGKTLCEILTAAGAMPLPVASLRVDCSLFRHGSVRLSFQRGGNRAAAGGLGRGCL